MEISAYIGILEENKVKAIYCHSFGYPAWTGNLLLNKYNSEELATKVIELGDLSHLDILLEPQLGENHSFEHQAKNVTVAYHRDRKEPLSIHYHESKKDFVKKVCGTKSCFSYMYLFDTKAKIWMYGKTTTGKGQRVFKQLSADRCKYL